MQTTAISVRTARTDTHSVTCRRQFFSIYNPWNKEVVLGGWRRACVRQEETESGSAGIIWEALPLPPVRLSARTRDLLIHLEPADDPPVCDLMYCPLRRVHLTPVWALHHQQLGPETSTCLTSINPRHVQLCCFPFFSLS